MADACRRAGRQPGDVTLVGVTKYVSADLAARLVEAESVAPRVLEALGDDAVPLRTLLSSAPLSARPA